MKKLLLSLLLVGLARAADPMPPSTIPLPESTNTWKLIFHDEFDGDTYDKTKWVPHADWGGINSFNGGREKYYESQIQVHDGVCHLVADPDTSVTTFEGSYKSGEILSCRDNSASPYKFTFQYGYVEARVKNVNIPGFFNDFWMLPAKTNYVYEWEIDILEVLGHDYYTMHQTYHYRPGLPYNLSRNTSWGTLNNPGRNGIGPDMNFSRDYHTFAVDWQPDHLTFYIDSMETGTFEDPGDNYENIPNSPGYIIFQQMVENTWIQGTGILLPNTSISETYYIDYVRVWQAEYDSSVGIDEERQWRDGTGTAILNARLARLPNPGTKYDIKRAGSDLRVFDLTGDEVDVNSLVPGKYFVGVPEMGALRQVMVIER